MTGEELGGGPLRVMGVGGFEMTMRYRPAAGAGESWCRNIQRSVSCLATFDVGGSDSLGRFRITGCRHRLAPSTVFLTRLFPSPWRVFADSLSMPSRHPLA